MLSPVFKVSHILKSTALAILILAGFSPLSAEPEYRKFKSTDGATIEAKIVSATPVSITIVRKDGKTFKDVPLERFSSGDRKFAREWRDAQAKAVSDADLTSGSKIKVTVKKGQDENMNSYGDIDDKVIEFKPGVIVENEDKDLTFRNVKCTLAIVGKGVVEKDVFVILEKQDFELDLIPREEASWSGKPFKCTYDPDYGGFEYAGYVMVLKNKAGAPTIIKASKSSWERNVTSILKAKKYMGYDRNFSDEHQLQTTFGLPR